jgi:outer membrane protein TolC
MHRPACAKPRGAAPEEGQRSALGCPDIHRGQGRSSGVQRGGSRSSLEIYNLGATASWEPDFWGINKRTNENARANEDRAKAQLADAQVSLSAQVAQAYVNLRDAQNRAVMVAQVVTLREQALGLVRQRHGAGVATLADVARYEGDMRSAMAQAAPIRAQVEVAMNQLAVLTGKAPGNWMPHWRRQAAARSARQGGGG